MQNLALRAIRVWNSLALQAIRACILLAMARKTDPEDWVKGLLGRVKNDFDSFYLEEITYRREMYIMIGRTGAENSKGRKHTITEANFKVFAFAKRAMDG